MARLFLPSSAEVAPLCGVFVVVADGCSGVLAEVTSAPSFVRTGSGGVRDMALDVLHITPQGQVLREVLESVLLLDIVVAPAAADKADDADVARYCRS